MSSKVLDIDPYDNSLNEIRITEDIAGACSLDKWAAEFSLMTAGYRDQLNPDNFNDLEAPFNSLLVAIVGEAKARVFATYAKEGVERSVHIGGETRPHTQEFIALLSRLYSAHGIRVHLRKTASTTPIWYSSFGVFYEGLESGDNFTASHSPFYKGGWKPMDGAGKQLLEQEKPIVEEVRKIVKNRQTIKLAPWEPNDLIVKDFDVDQAYTAYQNSLIIDSCKEDISRAVKDGFKVTICSVGGSMKATTERLFPAFGLPVGPDGAVSYIYGEENSEYHGIGQVDGKNVGPDPSKPEVYRNIGAQDILMKGKADIVAIWDPDGDRFNIVTRAEAQEIEKAGQYGLETEAGSPVVYFTPNQLFYMLTCYRIELLKEARLLKKYDWFSAPSISTTRSIAEVCRKEGLKVIETLVGFKYMGTLNESIERRKSPQQPVRNALGDEVFLGETPRALVMCEESGGAVFGAAKLLWNSERSEGAIALREKDGFQFGMMTLSLAAHLYNLKKSFAQYYMETIERYDIVNRFFNRKDVTLYDESLTGVEREKAKSEGMQKKEKIMNFFLALARDGESGKKTLPDIDAELAGLRAEGDVELPPLKRIATVGGGSFLEGMLMEFGDFWCLIRASGTDALIRYYVEAKELKSLLARQSTLVNLGI